MKYKKPAIIGVALVFLYTIVGFFALPAIVRPKLVSAIEENTHRPVHLGAVRINPFALSVALEDFEMKDRDSTRLLSFSRLYLNYEIISLFKGAYIFSDFRIDTPFVSIRVLNDGKLSVNDLMAQRSVDTTTREEGPSRLIIDNLVVTQGSARYQDDSRRKPLVREIDSLNLSLANFTTVPNEKGEYEFSATTARNEYLHWRGSVSVAPARSVGFLEVKNVRAPNLWEFMAERLKFKVESGLLDLRGDYDLDASGAKPLFTLRNGSIDVSGLILSDPNDSLPPLNIPRGKVRGIALDYPAQTLTLDSIDLEGAELRTAYLADGTITILDILSPIPDPTDTSTATLKMTVNAINTSGAKIMFIERMLDPEAPMEFSELKLDMKNLCYGKPGIAHLSATGILNRLGTASVEGTLSLIPKKADLKFQVSGTPLVALQPYFSRYSRAKNEGGTISAKGTIAYAGIGGKTSFRYRGDVTSDRARISDPVLNEDLIRWNRLELKALDYQLSPPRLSINQIVATRPYIRTIISPDRTLNFQHVLAPTGDSAAPATNVSRVRDDSGDTVRNEIHIVARPLERKNQERSPRTATTIGTVRIIDGTMNFSDLSLTPNFVVSIQQMGGTIKGLSSEQLARANVDISGKVDKYAPVLIQGQINPLSEEAYTDILLKFQGIELTTFTPYSGKFAGYKIDRGKLNLDLQYKLNNRYLDGSNKIVFDQLTLGEPVEGPEVTGLPVKLAIALLKDSHGVIDLDVPVSGSLDDPDFSLFPVILKAILNLLWKIVKAPFALIANLFGGGGEDLEYVSFRAGSDSLTAEQQAKLATIAKGLSDRPQLQMDVRGTVSNSADKEAIAESTIAQKVRPGGSGPLTLDDQKRLLSLYEDTFKEDATALVLQGGARDDDQEKAVFEAAQRRLVDSVKVSEIELRMLAQRRASAIMDYLTRAQGVDSTRLFLQEPETAAPLNEGQVRTTLSLTAR